MSKRQRACLPRGTMILSILIWASPYAATLHNMAESPSSPGLPYSWSSMARGCGGWQRRTEPGPRALSTPEAEQLASGLATLPGQGPSAFMECPGLLREERTLPHPSALPRTGIPPPFSPSVLAQVAPHLLPPPSGPQPYSPSSSDL